MDQTNLFVDGTRNKTKTELQQKQDKLRESWKTYAQLRKCNNLAEATKLYTTIQTQQKEIDQLICKLTQL